MASGRHGLYGGIYDCSGIGGGHVEQCLWHGLDGSGRSDMVDDSRRYPRL